MTQFRSFSSKMSAYIASASSVLLLCALISCGLFALKSLKDESLKVANSTLDTTVSDIETVMKEVESVVNNAIWVVKEHIDDPDYMFHITEQIVSNNPHIIGSAIAFEPEFYREKGEYFAPYSCIDTLSGGISTFQMGNNSYDYFTMEWYQLPTLMKEGRWTEPYYDEGGGQQIMTTYSAPLIDDQGKVFGVITSDFSLKDLTDIVEEISSFHDSYTILLGGTGSFLIHPDPEVRLNETIFTIALAAENEALMDIGREMMAGNRGSANFKEGKNRMFIVYGPLSNGWPAGIICSYQAMFAGLNRFMSIMVIICLLGLIALMKIDRMIIKRLSMPITEFTYTAQAIAKGNFNAQIPEVDTKDEFKRLRGSFTYMEQSINKYIRELRSSTADNERYESELNIANDIQMHMLSKNFPKMDGLDLFATVRPAKEVGGDLYDFIILGDKLYFIVGDVSGKGVPAAMFMAITKYAFHALAKAGMSASDLAFNVNNTFSEGNDSNMFVTIFIGCVDLKTGEMTYCNGGHNPIIIIDPDGSPKYIDAKPNLAAGLFEDFPYEQECTTLAMGSRLVIYTDGVTEAENASEDQFGEDRLIDFCRRADSGLPSEEFAAALLAEVKDFTGENDQNDDITIMSVRIGRSS